MDQWNDDLGCSGEGASLIVVLIVVLLLSMISACIAVLII